MSPPRIIKQTFPLSILMLLAPLDLWLRQLAVARFRVDLKYLPRLMTTLVFSVISTLLALPERILLPFFLRHRRVPDPVYILGTHRSGTTHLHNLMALDPQFYAPRLYQTMNPAGFLVAGWPIALLFAVILPRRRAMDRVRLGIFMPQEDEFALACSTGLSPWWGYAFPRCCAWYDRYIFLDRLSARERSAWQRCYRRFLQKLTLFSGHRPLLKNPYHTARVGLLREMFPAARFVHLRRHPYAVYQSNMHLVREFHVLQQVQDPDPGDSYATRFLANYRAMEESFEQESSRLPADQVVGLRFEDLEADAVAQIRRIYEQLGLQFSAEYEKRLTRYLEDHASYRKNRYGPLSESERQAVDTMMEPFLTRWGYAGRADSNRP